MIIRNKEVKRVIYIEDLYSFSNSKDPLLELYKHIAIKSNINIKDINISNVIINNNTAEALYEICKSNLKFHNPNLTKYGLNRYINEYWLNYGPNELYSDEEQLRNNCFYIV